MEIRGVVNGEPFSSLPKTWKRCSGDRPVILFLNCFMSAQQGSGHLLPQGRLQLEGADSVTMPRDNFVAPLLKHCSKSTQTTKNVGTCQLHRLG